MLLEMDSMPTNNNIEISTLDNVDKSSSLEIIEEESLNKRKIDEINKHLNDELEDEIMNVENFDNLLQDWLDMLEEE
ncbi:24612_t:CDS:1, partial [Cetraspora pellucida]